MTKLKLPKSIYRHSKTNKYHVSIWSKKYDKNYHIGYFETIEEAVKARDKFVVQNYNDITSGYLPRGISFQKGKYQVRFQFKGEEEYLGVFSDLKDAVDYRNQYIDSLK